MTGSMSRWAPKAIAGGGPSGAWLARKEFLALTSDLLNRYQRDSVAITLRTLEMALRGAQTELAHRDEGILYRQASTLFDEQRQQFQMLIDAALHEIADLTLKLALPVEVYDSRSALLGKLVALLVDLYDERAAKLARFGKTAPGLEKVLDPPLMRLIQVMEQLTKALAK
jgi:hypothetical protein